MKAHTPFIHIILFLIFLGTAVGLFWMAGGLLGSNNFLRAEISSLAENQSRLENLRITLPEIEQEERVWLDYLPQTGEHVASFANGLEQIARNRGMTITLDFDDFPALIDVGGKRFTGLGLSIALEGSYQGLTDFLTDLNKLHYFFKTDKMTILKNELRSGIKATFKGVLIMRSTT